LTEIAESQLAAVVDAHEAAEAAHDPEAVAATFAEAGVLDPKPTGATFVGRKEIAAWYTDLFTAFPDITPRLINRFRDGNTITDEVVFAGTHDGPFLGIPATGKSVEVPAAIIYDIEDGALRRESAYWDIATMLIQMGVLPPPPAAKADD
jgi:steroid delta-isomerase-like uncharacterized protein